jgi:HD-GYP domain-containing protein (c-di-GMP phosphodiesterase class II)
MKTFPVNTLEPSRYFTKQVYLDEKYILLSPETETTSEMINRLKLWRFRTVITDGEYVDKPIASDDAGERVGLSIDEDIKENARFQEAQKFFSELLTFVERMFTNFVTKSELHERAISGMVKRIAETLRTHRQYILRLTEMKAQDKNYIVDHACKTAILAIAVGMTVKLPPHRLIELGTAALVHEIGMIKLPPQLYMGSNRLTAEERRAITTHTLLGFQILRQQSFPNEVATAVLECREHVDGTGYPQGLTGERIGHYAKIVLVAASYSAITSQRPYRSPTDGHGAILEMLQQKAKRYDEQILRALIVTLSIYPIGTYVQLANGTRGMVVDTDSKNPRAPQVRVISGPNGEAFAEHPVVETSSAPEYAVARALSAREFQSTKT